MFYNLLFGLASQFSVGTPLQNFGVYSLLTLLLLVVIVQVNAHNEIGVRRTLFRAIKVAFHRRRDL